MDNLNIIVLIVVASYAGYRVYQKYIKKEVTGGVKSGGTSIGTTDSDDYEPYSKK